MDTQSDQHLGHWRAVGGRRTPWRGTATRKCLRSVNFNSLAATQAILDATMLLVPMLQSPVEMLKDRVGVESADARLLRDKFSVTMEHASGLVRSFVERWEAGEP